MKFLCYVCGREVNLNSLITNEEKVNLDNKLRKLSKLDDTPTNLIGRVTVNEIYTVEEKTDEKTGEKTKEKKVTRERFTCNPENPEGENCFSNTFNVIAD